PGASPPLPPSFESALGRLPALCPTLPYDRGLRSAHRGGWARGRFRGFRSLGPSRKIDLEGRAVAQLAVRPDVPAALLDDTVNRREPESRTPPRLAGREKRLQQARLVPPT